MPSTISIKSNTACTKPRTRNPLQSQNKSKSNTKTKHQQGIISIGNGPKLTFQTQSYLLIVIFLIFDGQQSQKLPRPKNWTQKLGEKYIFRVAKSYISLKPEIYEEFHCELKLEIYEVFQCECYFTYKKYFLILLYILGQLLQKKCACHQKLALDVGIFHSQRCHCPLL